MAPDHINLLGAADCSTGLKNSKLHADSYPDMSRKATSLFAATGTVNILLGFYYSEKKSTCGEIFLGPENMIALSRLN